MIKMLDFFLPVIILFYCKFCSYLCKCEVKIADQCKNEFVFFVKFGNEYNQNQ